MREGRRYGLSADQTADIWQRWKVGASCHCVRLEPAIMISCDDNFVPMRLTTEPCVDVNDLARRVSIGHEIARMDQNVAIGNT